MVNSRIPLMVANPIIDVADPFSKGINARNALVERDLALAQEGRAAEKFGDYQMDRSALENYRANPNDQTFKDLPLTAKNSVFDLKSKAMNARKGELEYKELVKTLGRRDSTRVLDSASYGLPRLTQTTQENTPERQAKYTQLIDSMNLPPEMASQYRQMPPTDENIGAVHDSVRRMVAQRQLAEIPLGSQPERAQVLAYLRANNIDPKSPEGVYLLSKPGGSNTVNIGAHQNEQGETVLGIGKAGQNTLDKAIINATSQIARLEGLEAGYDPDYGTKTYQVAAKLNDLILKVGGIDALSDEKKADLSKYYNFIADASRDLSLTLNSLSGAAVSPSEQKRFEEFLVTPNDNPVRMWQKIQNNLHYTRLALARAFYLKKEGVSEGNIRRQAKSAFDISLDGMDKKLTDRYNTLWRQYKKESDSSKTKLSNAVIAEKARMQVRTEFGYGGSKRRGAAQ